MNPLFISAVTGTIIGLKRTCPKCGRVQVVASNKRRKVYAVNSVEQKYLAARLLRATNRLLFTVI